MRESTRFSPCDPNAIALVSLDGGSVRPDRGSELSDSRIQIIRSLLAPACTQASAIRRFDQSRMANESHKVESLLRSK